MATLIFSVIATASLSSLLTLAIAVYYLRKHAKPGYDKAVAEAIVRFKAEVGPEIEQRVKQGVLEGIKSLPTREVLRDATRSLAKTGLDIMGDSLMNPTPPPPHRPGGTPPDED